MARRSDNLIETLLILGGGAYLSWKYIIPNLPQITGAVIDPVGSGVKVGTQIVQSAVRGVRNNNPGNIEYSILNQWQGQTGSDGRFAKFSAPVYGVRAMLILLQRYIKDYGLDTIAKIGSRWAPAGEKLNSAWASNVAKFAGIGMNTRINPADFNQMAALAKGVISAENGTSALSIFGNVISQAWSMR